MNLPECNLCRNYEPGECSGRFLNYGDCKKDVHEILAHRLPSGACGLFEPKPVERELP